MKNKEYHKVYNLARHHRIIQEAKEQLGGRCVLCASEESLEFDHIDPETKSFNIGNWISHSASDLHTELKKCRLLCKDCHILRHSSTGHGTLTMYTGKHRCRCVECRTAWNSYMTPYKKAWRLRRKQVLDN